MSDYTMKTFEDFQYPYSVDTSILGRKVFIRGDGITLKNSISIHPMEASDAMPDGTPSSYTHRRCTRFAESGAALVWVESIAVQEDGRSNESSLWITKQNLDEYKCLVEDIKKVDSNIIVIAQLTHSGRFSKPHNKPAPVIAIFNPHYNGSVTLPVDYPLITDEYLDRLEEQFIVSASLCKQAGFDGVDIKACHGYLVNELFSAHARSGRYGGSYENRTRFFRETVSNIKSRFGNSLMVASRFSYADTIPYPYGFGMSQNSLFDYDFDEPIRLLQDAHEAGVNLIDMSVGKKRINLDYADGKVTGNTGESSIQYFNRFFTGTKKMHEACPELTIIGSDYSALKGEAPYVAAGALASDSVSMIGFGRMALAYSDFANAIIEGRFDSDRACRNCGSCSTLLRSHIPSGCAVFDKEIYLPLLKSLKS